MSRKPNNIVEGVNLAGRRLRLLGGAAIFLTPIAFMAYVGLKGEGDNFNTPTPQPHDNASASAPFDGAVQPAPTTEEIAAAVTEAVNESLELYQTSEITEESIAALEIDGLYLDPDSGDVNYENWADPEKPFVIPSEVHEANLRTTHIIPVPLDYMIHLEAVESSFRPNAFNGMEACGLTQPVRTTLRQESYQYAETIGFDGINNLVEEYVSSRDENENPNLAYRFHDYYSEQGLTVTCWDPEFNTRLGAMITLENVSRLQNSFHDLRPEGMDYYPVTYTQAYFAHYAGVGGARSLLNDIANNNGEGSIIDFFGQDAIDDPNNQPLLFHTKKITDDDGTEREVIDLENPRTVADFFELIAQEKGFSDQVFPDYRDLDGLVESVEANFSQAGFERVALERPDNLLYSERPRLRPDSLSAIAARSTTLDSSLRPMPRPAQEEGPDVQRLASDLNLTY